jgi:two-component system cell cycle sensor histidine kinase/response regulator CckA
MGAGSDKERELEATLADLRRELEEHRRTEKGLREQAGQYDRLFNRIVDAVIIHDKETHRIVHWNEAVLRIYGYSEDDLQAMTPFDLHPEEDMEAVRQNIGVRNVIRANTYTHLTKSGRAIDVEILSDDLDYAGRPAWISIVRDITERRQLERQLLHSQKMEAVGTLAGGVAHDMNNVLAGILSYASLLAADMGESDSQLSDVKEIIGLCGRGRDLARNLLGYARKGQYRSVSIAAQDLVGDVRAILERTIPKRIDIQVELPDHELLHVMGDPGQLSNALMNVCLNAVDALQDRGELVISVRDLELGERDLGNRPSLAPGHYLQLAVRDTGTGMSPEVLERACEPFFTTKPAGIGSGLGLAMVYGTIENHGGFVTIDSLSGKGTTVALHIPLAEVLELDPGVPESRIPPPRADAGVVLFVDDERPLRRSGKRLLQLLGYDVLLAADGRAAVEVYQKHRDEIALVILDLAMPVMDGFETLARLREMDREVKVLICTGYGSDDRTRAAFRCGQVDVLEKPFGLKDLSRAVEAALAKPSLPPP